MLKLVSPIYKHVIVKRYACYLFRDTFDYEDVTYDIVKVELAKGLCIQDPPSYIWQYIIFGIVLGPIGLILASLLHPKVTLMTYKVTLGNGNMFGVQTNKRDAIKFFNSYL